MCPHFSFCHLAPGFGVADCQQAQKAEFAQRLQELSGLTWGDINQAPRDGFGTEKIAQGSVRPAIPSHLSPDVNLLSFQFGGGSRIIGYRDHQVFHVVWIDPNHRVYTG